MDINVTPITDKMMNLSPLMVNINDLPRDILNDISDATSLNKIKLNEYEPLDRLIDIYLQWKGICGFSKDITEIIKQSFQAKIETKDEFRNVS